MRDGWLGSPRICLRQEALHNNLDVMAHFCDDAGVTLYPHGKTRCHRRSSPNSSSGAPGE